MEIFEATFRNKRGSIRDTEYAITRESAARALFKRNKTARTVQTCKAYYDGSRPRGNGMDIRWLSREEVKLPTREEAINDHCHYE